MKFFYILPGPFRTGFGITIDAKNRQKDYTAAWGGEASFSHIYKGPAPFIDRLEGIIKIQYKEMLWTPDDVWVAEWLDNKWTADQLAEFVEQIILQRHYPIIRIK